MTSKDSARQEIQISPHEKLVLRVDWCKSCGICMEICQREVLGAEEVTNKVILLAPERCNGCGLCEIACPDYVFTLKELEV